MQPVSILLNIFWILLGGAWMAFGWLIAAVVMAMREDVGLSWLIVVVVPVLALSVGLIVRQMVPSFRVMQVRIAVSVAM